MLRTLKEGWRRVLRTLKEGWSPTTNLIPLLKITRFHQGWYPILIISPLSFVILSKRLRKNDKFGLYIWPHLFHYPYSMSSQLMCQGVWVNFLGEFWDFGSQETGFLLRFIVTNRDLIKKPVVWNLGSSIRAKHSGSQINSLPHKLSAGMLRPYRRFRNHGQTELKAARGIAAKSTGLAPMGALQLTPR